MSKRHHNERIVDTFIYKYKGPSEVAGADGEGEPTTVKIVEDKVVKVELLLEKRFAHADEAPYPTGPVKFILRCKDIETTLEGTDVEALRVAMWEKLDVRYAIKWQDWFLVKIDPSRLIDGLGAGLEFTYKRIEQGIAWDGSKLLREYERGAYGRHVVSPWPGDFRDDHGRTIACVPATEENEKALEAFAAKIVELRKHMRKFFRPETILGTLADLSGTPLLMPPSEDTGEKPETER